MDFSDSQWFAWVVIPLLIFGARVLDVSIGTLRIVYIARGKRIIAPILGFFEVLIWLLAIGQIFKHLDNVACYIAWAAGFGMGNYVGMVIEHKLAIGIEVIRIITRANADNLITHLKSNGYGVTVVDGQGSTGPVKIIFMLIQRKDLPKVTAIVNQHNPKAFYTVEDVQFAKEATFPLSTAHRKRFYRQLFRMDRKRK